jgi:hypothetical protein
MSGTTDTLTSGNDIFESSQPWANNTIYGVGGDDSLSGAGADDYLDGGTGNDTLLAGGGNDLLLGDDGNDSLVGGGYGDATLDGGEGNDHLVAGASGNQFMDGGAGDDTFSGITNNSLKFIDGGGGDDLVIVPADYDPDALSLTPGVEPTTGQAYDASYVTDTGYRLYFTNFDGTLQFNDGSVSLNVVCFAAGTLIMTPQGERPVESLRSGDLVVTVSGRGAVFKPVLWVGRREVDLDTHPRAADVAPILVMPGALGEGMPHRPLRVSPDHAMLVDDVLVPARLLVDGEMIRATPAKGRVTYFHVELEAHDILLAEGAPSESYIDFGNRSAFDNAGMVRMLHPDFAPRREGGMPRVTSGPALDKALTSLAERRAPVVRRERKSG